MTPSLRPQTCERPPCVQSQVPSRSDGAQGLLEERRAFSPDRDRDRDRDPDRDHDPDPDPDRAPNSTAPEGAVLWLPTKVVTSLA